MIKFALLCHHCMINYSTRNVWSPRELLYIEIPSTFSDTGYNPSKSDIHSSSKENLNKFDVWQHLVFSTYLSHCFYWRAKITQKSMLVSTYRPWVQGKLQKAYDSEELWIAEFKASVISHHPRLHRILCKIFSFILILPLFTKVGIGRDLASRIA
jgi:hypothetical protein